MYRKRESTHSDLGRSGTYVVPLVSVTSLAVGKEVFTANLSYIFRLVPQPFMCRKRGKHRGTVAHRVESRALCYSCV